ncbi:TIGR03745 family integrating conjugative element membrane protein [Rodentibacter caecimuris]|uniref:TIGR03745 family integrating conjugative element membrane protein n=1 Tax=Rodentibacter caecimuris TaxID=1796644 RepID=UPI0013A09372|nr:TIGR03745 family integrating conjugative element membrane protein [Rodentibacter heylii]QIA76789.1 TIGR03745 family integrating conjugative element membrane protein [Rodentibacter heylii]
MKTFVKLKQYGKQAALAIPLLALQTGNALATGGGGKGIPKMDAPSRGEGSGIIENVKNYGFDIATLLGLLVCCWAFFVVAGSTIETFREVRAGKKTWGEFGMICGVGVGLLVVIIWLISKAIDML